MSAYDNLDPMKSMLWTIIFNLIGFGISFGIVYWIGTKDLGLCFVIALAMASSASNAKQELSFFIKKLLPIFQSIDDNINGLISEKDRLEQQIEELEEKVRALDCRIDELQA